MAAVGWPTIVDPYLTTAPTPDSAPARRLLDHIEALTLSSPTTWLVLTSPRARCGTGRGTSARATSTSPWRERSRTGCGSPSREATADSPAP